MLVNESTAEAVLVIGLFQDLNGEIMTPLSRSDGFTTPQWRIPGGGREAGEKIREAAEREFLEEVGLVVSDLRIFMSVTKPSRDPMHKGHLQHVLIGVVNSISDFKTTTQDGTETLTNELFRVNNIREAIRCQRPLAHYEILRFHGQYLKEAFHRLFG